MEERGSSERGGTKMAEMAFMVSYVTWMDALARQAWPSSRCPHHCPDLPACVGTMLCMDSRSRAKEQARWFKNNNIGKVFQNLFT